MKKMSTRHKNSITKTFSSADKDSDSNNFLTTLSEESVSNGMESTQIIEQ
jgi:hypothetical protein